MKIEHLKTFLAAAEHLNFTQAARRLYLSQPAVSQQIRELEEGLGVVLFERRGRGLLLTPAGELLKLRAAPLLSEFRKTQVELESLAGTPQGVVRIGGSNVPGLYVLPRALGAFSSAAPGVRVTLTLHPPEELVTRLLGGDLDLIVTQEEPPAARIPGWEKVPLWDDELVLVAWPEHPFARRASVRVTELAAETYISRQSGSATDELVMERLVAAGLDAEALTSRFELGHPEGIKQAVMAGLGLGFVSRYAVTAEQRAGLLAEVPIEGVSIRRSLWLVRPPLERLPDHMRDFCALLAQGGWRSEPVPAGRDGIR